MTYLEARGQEPLKVKNADFIIYKLKYGSTSYRTTLIRAPAYYYAKQIFIGRIKKRDALYEVQQDLIKTNGLFH